VDTSMGEIGIDQSGKLQLLGNVNTSGSVFLGASGQLMVQDQSLASAGAIRLSGANVRVEAQALATQVNAAGNLQVTGTSTLTVKGSDTTVNTDAKLKSGATLTIDAGTVKVQGGNAAFSDASIDPVSLAMTLTGDLNLIGGNAQDAFAVLEAPTGDVSLTLQVDPGLIATAPPGTVLLPGVITLTPGTGMNADALIAANAGLGQVTVVAGGCINCIPLIPPDPRQDLVTQAGIFGNLAFTAAAPVTVPQTTVATAPVDGADQVIVTDDTQTLVFLLLPTVDESGDEDEGKRVLMCR